MTTLLSVLKETHVWTLNQGTSTACQDGERSQGSRTRSVRKLITPEKLSLTSDEQTVEGIDAQRGPAAATLDHSAAALHQQANTLASVAHATADKLHTTADYVRTQDVKAMAKDVGDLVRRYPGSALAIAAAAGFIAARVVRSRA